MSRIIAFCGSNSSSSINHQVLSFLSDRNSELELIDLREWEFPLYSIDLESENGIPASILTLMELIEKADSVLISTPEHNGMTPAYFKSILDWLSRTGVKYLTGKKTAVMSVSTGKGGAAKAASYVEKLVGYAGGELVKGVNFPSFNENFTNGEVNNSDILQHLDTMIADLVS